MIDPKILEDGEKKLEADLRKLFAKSELSSADWDAVKKALCIAGMIANYPEYMDEEGASYGMPRMRSYGHMDRDMDRDSYGMRSPVTGRYVSHHGMEPMDRGYSGHSVEDRMVMALEKSIEPGMNEYERQQIEKQIRHIRRGDM